MPGVPKIDLEAIVHRVDRWQQRHRVPAFVFAVMQKFGDDRGGNLASLITYYGFVSLFPLLLVAVTVLGFVLHDRPDVQQRVLDSALSNFPIIGDQIQANVKTVRGSGIALFFGIIITLYGGLGIANVSQNAMNRIWGVPRYAEPGFFPRLARSLGLIGTIGLGILATTVLSGIATRTVSGVVPQALVAVVAILLYVALFTLAFQLLVAEGVPWRDLLPGAIVAGVAWHVFQTLGVLYVSRVLQGMSQVYGLFALVLGLFAWINLEARVVLYAMEVNAVRARRLWPRAMAPPRTEADHRAYELYVRNSEFERAEQAGRTLEPQAASEPEA